MQNSSSPEFFISFIKILLDSNPSTKWRRARGRGCLRVIPILGKLRNMNGFWLRNFLRRFSPPLPLHTTNSGSSALSLISFWLLLATTPTCGSCQTKAFPYLLDSRETKDNDFFWVMMWRISYIIYDDMNEWCLIWWRLFSNLFSIHQMCKSIWTYTRTNFQNTIGLDFFWHLNLQIF